MPNKRIQDLPKVDQLTSGDIFPLGRASASYDAYGVTGQQLTDFIKAEAQTFVDAAEKSATEAESSKIAAAQSVTQANAAKDAADLAKTGAETAKSGAESAQAAAEESRQAIENMTVSAQEVGSDEPVAVQKTIVEGVVNLLFSLKAGPTGQQGPQGTPGSSIQKIERTSGTGAPGTIDTYTITLTDGGTSTFQVYNGADGQGAGDMLARIYDPTGKATDIYAYVDDKIAAIPTPDVSGQIGEHNSSPDAHQDIRNAIPKTAGDVGADPEGSANQALTDAKEYTDTKISQIPHPDLSGKIDKVSSATSGNIATLTSDGGIQDSGKAIDDLGSSNLVQVTLSTGSWTDNGDGRYKQTVSVAGVTTTTKVIVVDCDLSTNDTNAKVEILTAWDGPAANDVTQGDGTLTFYCYDIPTVNIPVNVGVM